VLGVIALKPYLALSDACRTFRRNIDGQRLCDGAASPIQADRNMQICILREEGFQHHARPVEKANSAFGEKLFDAPFTRGGQHDLAERD
jgi:hypothetical protein